MKKNYWKSVILLVLSVALLTAMLSGCSRYGELPVTSPGIAELSASPDDTYYESGLLWAAEIMELPEAWDISTGASTIRVGVIDSGIDITHPDLQDRVNVSLSESFISGYSPLEDQNGHRTHVAGIIGAHGDNSIGVTGVCWDVEIVSLRVSNEYGHANPSALISAINSANNKGIHILNISLGCSANALSNFDIQALMDAIDSFDGLIVCSAGNLTDKSPVQNNDVSPMYPSSIRANNLISVGASTPSDTMWEYSHYGATTVDIFAPGCSILNCYPSQKCTNGTCNSDYHRTNGYHSLSGTSMAAPNVAGVAALILAIHPELSAAELKNIIMDSADIVFDNTGNNVFGSLCVSGGRLNAYAALSAVSLHNFGSWRNADLSYHERTCTTCGYVQRQAHKDCWDKLRDRCFVCGRTGPVPDDPFFVPVEEDELTKTQIITYADAA